MCAPATKIKGNSFYEKMIEGLDRLSSSAQEWIKGMQDMFKKAVCNNPYTLRHVPDWFKTGEMCDEAVRREPYNLLYVPDHFIMQEMCNEAMRENPAAFFLIPDHFKT